uniref:Ovule protein n=1 Tax=Mesocestoides corti TaxID=53468 RepID=A0A5K3FGB4_MESCO
ESCFSTSLNPAAPPPTQGSPFRSISPVVRILNSPLIHMDIYLGLSSHLGFDVSA